LILNTDVVPGIDTVVLTSRMKLNGMDPRDKPEDDGLEEYETN